MGSVLQTGTSRKQFCIDSVLTDGKCGKNRIVYHPATTFCKTYSCSAICRKTGKRCTNQPISYKGFGLLSMLVLELNFTSACCKLCEEHVIAMKHMLKSVSHNASQQVLLYYISKDIKGLFGTDELFTAAHGPRDNLHIFKQLEKTPHKALLDNFPIFGYNLAKFFEQSINSIIRGKSNSNWLTRRFTCPRSDNM